MIPYRWMYISLFGYLVSRRCKRIIHDVQRLVGRLAFSGENPRIDLWLAVSLSRDTLSNGVRFCWTKSNIFHTQKALIPMLPKWQGLYIRSSAGFRHG